MNFSPQKAIFLQIAEKIENQILSGEYPEGGKVLSVRELGVSLGVNPATVLRAYDELSVLGILEQRRGVGYFVCTDATENIYSRKRNEFFKIKLPALLQEADALGITFEDIKDYILK